MEKPVEPITGPPSLSATAAARAAIAARLIRCHARGRGAPEGERERGLGDREKRLREGVVSGEGNPNSCLYTPGDISSRDGLFGLRDGASVI